MRYCYICTNILMIFKGDAQHVNFAMLSCNGDAIFMTFFKKVLMDVLKLMVNY